MSYRLFTPTAASPAFSRTWIVEAKWAHPLWDSYVVLLYDITTEIPGQQAPVIYKEGVTHEFMVWALNPEYPSEPPIHMLTPANHGYQFEAESDEAAETRIISLLELIATHRLSPDTDFRSMWDAVLVDAVSLHGKGGAA